MFDVVQHSTGRYTTFEKFAFKILRLKEIEKNDNSAIETVLNIERRWKIQTAAQGFNR